MISVAYSRQWRIAFSAFIGVGLLLIGGYAVARDSGDSQAEESEVAAIQASGAAIANLVLAQAEQEPAEIPPPPPAPEDADESGAPTEDAGQPHPAAPAEADANTAEAPAHMNGDIGRPPRGADGNADPTRRFQERIEAQRRAQRAARASQDPSESPEMRKDSEALPDVSEDELSALEERLRAEAASGTQTDSSEQAVPAPPSAPDRGSAAQPRRSHDRGAIPRPSPGGPMPSPGRRTSPTRDAGATQAPAATPGQAPGPGATPQPVRPGHPIRPTRPEQATPPSAQPEQPAVQPSPSGPGSQPAQPTIQPTPPSSPNRPVPPAPPAGGADSGTSSPLTLGEEYEVRTNEQTKEPEFVRPKEYFRLPAEERMYFFAWKNTPLQKTLEDVVEMSGLNLLGEIVQPDSTLPITFESVQMEGFDDALTTYNEILQEKGYWVIRMDQYLGVRRLTDWYRYIPAARIYKTVEDYVKADLPAWDLASVRYEPKYVSGGVLATMLNDMVPDNTARATVVADSNKIELRGFVGYINKQLDLAAAFDVDGNDGREWKAYPLQYAAPSVALEMLAELMPPASGGPASVVRAPSTPSAVRRPTARPTPTEDAANVGISTADEVEIREDKRKNQLLVRANEAKHKLVADYIKEFIDVPIQTGERKEVINLEHTDPEEMVEKITPLLGRRELYQPPAPPPRPGPGGTQIEQPAPPPQFRSIGSTAVMVPLESSNSILVKATEDEMLQIKEYIAMLDIEAPDEGKLQYITLEHGSASNIASVLSTIFTQRSYRPGTRQTTEGFKAVPDSATDKAIIIGGEKKDMDAAKVLISQLDVDPQADATEHIVLLENAVPSAMAETLSSRFGQSGGGGRGYYGRGYYGGGGDSALPRFLPNDTAKMLIVLCRDDMWEDIDRLIRQVDDQSKIATFTRTYRLKHADAGMMTNLLSESLSNRGGGGSRRYYYAPSTDPNAPMFMHEPQNNGVIITALEEIHAKAKELINELDQPSPSDQASWRSIQLSHADAEEVEDTLEDVFERGGGSRRRGGYYSGYSSYGSDGSGSPAKVPVRIVAETVSNKLLVSSSEEDFVEIEKLAKEIDSESAAKEMVRRTFELKYAEPNEVSEIVQTAFESRSSSRWGRSSSGSNLGVRVSEIGRGLIVQAPKNKMEEVAKLIAEVDTDATSGNEIKTYKVTNAGYMGTYGLAESLRQLHSKGGSSYRGQSGSSSVKFIGEYGSNVLMVSAPSHRMPEIDKMVNEMIQAKQGVDLTMNIRHFDVRQAKPQEIADIIEPVLETRYQELQQQSGGGGRSFWGGWGGSSGPRVTAHKNENRIMVSAPTVLMDTVEELIAEFDRPSRPSTTRIISLVTAKAVDIAPIVEEQLADGSSSGGRSSGYPGWSYRWSSRRSSGSESTELTVTAVESSNSIILNGVEQKVADAEALIKELDEGARPEGTFKVIKIVSADLREVADMVEDIVGGGSSDYGYSSRRRSSSAGANVTVRTDYQTNQLIVYGPPEKFPIIEQIVGQMETLAMARNEQADASGLAGKQIGGSGREIQMLYDVKGPAKEVAEVLDKAMYELYGWDAPYIKPYTFTNQIIVDGDPKYFAQVEKLLKEIEKDPPKPKIMMAARRVKDPQKVLQQVQRFASSQGMNIRPIARAGQNPMDAIQRREVNWWDPINPPASNEEQEEPAVREVGSTQFVPPVGELAQMKASVSAVLMSATTTQPASTTKPAGTGAKSTGGQAASGTKQAASGTKPAASGTKPATAPSAAEALLEGFLKEGATLPAKAASAATKPADSRQVEAKPAATEKAPAAPDKVNTQAKATPAPATAPAAAAPAEKAAPAKKDAPAAAAAKPAEPVKQETPAQAAAPADKVAPAQAAAPAARNTPAQPAAGQSQASHDEMVYNELNAAAGEAREQLQVRYDPEQGVIFIIGQESDVKEFDYLLDTITKEMTELEDATKTEFRVFKVEHVAVEVAAMILEQMFNEQVQPQQRQQQAAQRRQAQRNQSQSDQGEDEEGGSSSRRREEEEKKKQEEAQAQAAAAAAAQRIKVIPDPRTGTLIIRSSPETFPAIAELLLKIDRPGGGMGQKIKLFQLEKLNAGEVEQAIKAILKIDDGTTRGLRSRGLSRGLRGSRGGGAEADLIDRLQEEMLELQWQQEQAAAVEAASAAQQGQGANGTNGKLRLNPAKDIMITSDATTNTIIVAAPEEGITLVENLIDQLEKLEVPLEIKSFAVENADAEKVAGELQKIFAPDRTGGGGGGRFGEGFTPGRTSGDIKIAADSRAGTIVVRALKPDMDKLEPLIKQLDVPPKEQQVAIYPIGAGDATQMAATLSKVFAEPGETGTRAVRIQADADTNSLLVYAPTQAKQLLIASKIKELDEKVVQRTEPQKIELEFANAASVAETLQSIFVPRGRRGAQRIEITGDNNSRTLFVMAPEEIFKQIQKVARDVDKPTNQDVRVIKLKNAVATDIEATFKGLLTQMLTQLRGQGGAMEIPAVTPDPRTNSLIVIGTPAAFVVMEQALRLLDVPPDDQSTPTVAMFPIAGGRADSAVSSINSIYAGSAFPGGVKPPRAVASGKDMIYVYGTGKQIQDIKAQIIDPMEAAIKPQLTAVQKSEFTVQHAKADEVAKKLQEYFKSRDSAYRAAGTTLLPSETVVEIVADPLAKKLYVHCSESNRKTIEELLPAIDIPEASNAGLDMKVLPVKNADVTLAYQAVNAMFQRSDRPVNERPVISYEAGSRSLLVKAIPEDMARIEQLVAELDSQDAGESLPPETVRIDQVRASEVVSQLNTIISQTKRRDRATGQMPVTVSGNDSSNTVIISARSQGELDEIKGLIAKLDSRPADGQREIRPYVLKYADLGAAIQALNANYAANASGPMKERVTATPDYTTSSLLVTASAENHEAIAKIIAQLDSADIQDTLPRPETIQVKNVRATQLAQRLTQMIPTIYRIDRRTGRYPVNVVGDDTSNTLLVTAKAEEMDRIRQLISDLDVGADSDGRMVKPYVLKYADLGAAMQALNANFAANTNRPVKDQVTATPDYTTSSLLVTASDTNHEVVAKIVAELDDANVQDNLPRPETIQVKNVRATQLAQRLTQMIPTIYRIDRRTGRYPVNVVGDDTSNTLLVTAKAEEMDRIRQLISDLDVGADADDRVVKPYAVQYADLTAVYQTIMGRFPADRNKANRDQVSVNLDYTNSTVIVTASPDNQLVVEELVQGLDRLDNVGRRETRSIKLSKARAGEAATTLSSLIRASASQRRTPAPTVQANEATNALLVTATEKDFADIEKLVKEVLDIEPSADAERTPKVYSLKYADLSSVISAINSSFRSSRNLAETVTAVSESGTQSAIVMANAQNHEQVAKLIEELDQPGAGTRDTHTIELKYADPEDVLTALTEIYGTTSRGGRGAQAPTFTTVQGTRKLLVTTTATELENIKAIIEQLDLEEAGEARDMRVVSVQRIAPQEMGQMLTEYLRKPSSGGRRSSELLGDVRIIPSVGAGAVVLTGPADRLDELEQLVTKVDEAKGLDDEARGRQIAVIPLVNADPSSVASAINNSFRKTGQVAEADQVQAVSERTTNTVVVTATPDNLEKVRNMIKELDENSSNVPRQEIVSLQHARAQDMVDVLTQTYRGSRRAGSGAQITFAADTNGNAVVISAGEADLQAVKDMIAQLDRPATDTLQEMRIMPLEHIDATETASLLTEHFRKPGGTSGRRGSSGELVGDIRIQASTLMNALIVSGSSDDLDKIQGMIHGMDRDIGVTGAPKIIKLEHAACAQMAQTLTQMFTDPAKQTRGRTSPESVPLIVADETSGSLLVRARNVDYKIIEDMVEQLDVASDMSGAKIIKVSRGVDVATLSKTIQDTINQGERYKKQMQPTYRPGSVAIGYDERVPAFIVAGSSELFKQVETLVAELDDGAKRNGSPRTVIIPVGDPSGMKRVLDQVIQQHTGVRQK